MSEPIVKNPRKPKPLPPQSFLMDCIDYNPETGDATWKRRPFSHFRTIADANKQNAKMTGKVVGFKFVANKGAGPIYRQVTMYHNGSRHHFFLHRLVWMIHYGIDPLDNEVDHRDRNGLNNRIDNLRLCTHSQNHYNKVRPPAKRGLPKGIFRNPNGKRYVAILVRHRSRRHLGTFDTIQEAQTVYNRALTLAAGEFANFEVKAC